MKIKLNKQNTTLNTKLISTLLLSQLAFLSPINALEVSINGSGDLSLTGGIVYDYQTSPSTISFGVNNSFACTSIFNSNAPIVLDVTDANNVALTTMNNGVLNTVYDVQNGKVKLTTDESIQCVAQGGVFQERIYIHGFEESVKDLQITLVDGIGNPFAASVFIADQQELDYQYVIENNGALPLDADIVEFYMLDMTKPYFSGVAGDDWVCNEVDTTGGSTTDCGDFIVGDDFVLLKNAIVDPGEKLVIEVSRIVEIPTGTVGTNLDLLAAAFAINDGDTIIDNNSIFKVFGTTTNTASTITFSSMAAFDEDSISSVVGFTVTDPDMNDNDIIITATSSDITIIPDSNITLGGSGSARTIQVAPLAEANTETDPVTITIVADDGFTTSTQSFNVTINPINDKPSFDFACIDTLVDTQTGIISCTDSVNRALEIDSFVTGVDLGNAFDASAQTVDEYIVEIAPGGDPNGVIHSDLGGASVDIDPVSNKLTFSLVSGNYGTAVINVQMRDSGGLPGIDLSDVKQFTLEVPVPEYVFTVDVTGLPNFENFNLRLVDTTTGNVTVSLTQISTNGQTDIGQLELGSDYKIFIDGTSSGATGCAISGADGAGDFIGNNLSNHVTIKAACD